MLVFNFSLHSLALGICVTDGGNWSIIIIILLGNVVCKYNAS